jgi:rhodanese-related sulfurtransferase
LYKKLSALISPQEEIMTSTKTIVFAVAATLGSFCTLATAATIVAAKPTIAKICTNCHKAEPNALRGYLDNISLKSKAIQIKMDDVVEVLPFDDKSIQVINEERKSGNGELFKNNGVKKGHEVRVEFIEKDGVKTAVKLTAKPPVEISKEMLMTTDELFKLVAIGPEKGKYHLYDSRPAPRFTEGAIPTAVNLPFPAFDKVAEKLLPADKKALLIFYCSGVTCNMSPGSATKAQKLGYTNIKVYKDGMPAWSEKHYGVLSAQSLKEAWLDKDVSHVLLDARPKAQSAKENIKGSVTFAASRAKSLVKGLELKQKKAPIIIYDAGNGKDSSVVAAELLKAGYGNVKIVSGGIDAWKAAKFQVVSANPATKVVFVPKLKQGEIDVEEFKNYVASPVANVVIVDVRQPEETKAGILKNAMTLPLADIRERASELPKDKLILLQCNTGTQAEIAYNALKDMGYTNMKYLNAKVTFEKNGEYKISKD